MYCTLIRRKTVTVGRNDFLSVKLAGYLALDKERSLNRGLNCARHFGVFKGDNKHGIGDPAMLSKCVADVLQVHTVLGAWVYHAMLYLVHLLANNVSKIQHNSL